ncbi:MAG TPA: ABC transporter permease [Kofleriaceae bacterium]|nr:ABC transporter permease [Kofleriaceae bacterium]
MSVVWDLVVSIFSLAFVAQTVRITVPYLLAAMGGTLCERSGIVDLALEAKLLCGAFTAAVIGHETGSIPLAILGAAGAGALVGAIHATWAIALRADQIVTGIALNMAAYGLTRYLLQVWYGQGANSPGFDGIGSAVWSSPLVWLALVLTAGAIVLVARTPLGLRIRAAGERPDATAAAGVSVAQTRVIAVIAGSALAGVGGAQLSLAVNGFVAEMSSGRGYVALAIVIMGGWRPAWVALVCLGFGAAEAVQARMQAVGTGLPPELVRLLPYILALVLLATLRSRGRAPSALGKPL